jgi:flagellar protein FlaG
MVLFIAGLVVAASVAGTLITQVDRFEDALSATSIDVSQQVRTDVEIISDSGAQVYDRNGQNNVTIYVRNTGSEDLEATASQLSVLFDGELQTDVYVSVESGGPGWSQGGVVNVTFGAGSLAGGTDHRVKLIVDGDEETFQFRT